MFRVFGVKKVTFSVKKLPLAIFTPLKCPKIRHRFFSYVVKQQKERKKKSLTKRLRLSQDEWESIQEKMKLESQENFSKFALASMLNKTPKKQVGVNKEFVIELAKWGNNLNQIAKHLNSNKGGMDRVGLEMLKRIEEHLQALRLQNGC